MKKISIYFLIFLAVFSFSASLVFAEEESKKLEFQANNCKVTYQAGQKDTSDFLNTMRDCANGTNGVSIDNISQENSVNGLSENIKKLASGFMRYAALFAVGAIVIAGIMYTTAYGDDGRLKKAKNIAIFALVGLLLALASYSLVNAVIYIIYGAIS